MRPNEERNSPASRLPPFIPSGCGGAMRGSYCGVELGPTQVFPTGIQAMTPARPPRDLDPGDPPPSRNERMGDPLPRLYLPPYLPNLSPAPLTIGDRVTIWVVSGLLGGGVLTALSFWLLR